MRIKTLVILSVVFFLMGGLFGGGYGVLTAQHIITPVFAGLTQTPEEKMINNFIADQEQKKTDDSRDAGKDKADSKPAANSPSEAQADKPATDGAKPPAKADQGKTTAAGDDSWIKLGKGEQVGTPTVKDGASLRLRKEASKSADTVGSVYNSDKLILDSKKNGWYHVKTKSGLEGWVAAEYIKIIK